MGLKYRIDCFVRKTEEHIVTEFSKDFGEDYSLMDAIGIPIHDNINNGGFNVEQWWIPILQPHFKHNLNDPTEWIQISFDYRDEW